MSIRRSKYVLVPNNRNGGFRKASFAYWFQYITSQAMLDNLTTLKDVPSGERIGDFTVMMRDSSISVGCSAITYKEPSWNMTLLFRCNYCANNIMGRPVYMTSDKPAAGCRTNTNPDYPALCSAKEVYKRWTICYHYLISQFICNEQINHFQSYLLPFESIVSFHTI